MSKIAFLFLSIDNLYYSNLWKMFFNDILAHAFAEKMVAMNCSQKPETYETLASINKSDIKETMSVANKFYSNEFNKFMSLLHSEKVT